MTRTNVVDPRETHYEPRDEFERVLLHAWVAAAFHHGKRREAANMRHLWDAYRCGVSQEEVLERIDAGEVTR